LRITPALQPLVNALAPHFVALDGRRIRVRFQPALTASRGKLLSNAEYGRPVHAASFIRKRELILESELRAHPRELSRVFTHELFHFVWARLGNTTRASYDRLIREELRARARGELGWSAQHLKAALKTTGQHRSWRVYICESFCDTAAYLYAECDHHHQEFTLSKKWRTRRETWFRESFANRVLSI